MSEERWGRADTDGTVWVRTADGERVVGQFPGVTQDEALAYFARKFTDLQAQVDLLEQRIRAGQVSPSDAEASLSRLRQAVSGANAVGDLDGLTRRLDEIAPIARQRRAEAQQARQAARERSLALRTEVVIEAEQLAAADPERISWKSSGDRLRELFEEWRRLQREARLDKHTEDDLWRRFSAARTSFDRKRRHHFGALDEQRAQVKELKEQIVVEAEALASSTEWGATAAGFRELMNRWKAAGRASKRDDDALWARFRTAQDTFFAARQASAAENDTRLRENLALKESLLAEAEGLLPVTNPNSARASLRAIQERWAAAGRVPRADLARIEARLRHIEQAVNTAEQERWRRNNPEGRARASDAVTQLQATIAGLEAERDTARQAGNDGAVEAAEQALAARREWLDQAQRALDDYSP